MFEVNDLTKVYPGGRGIQGLNLAVRTGEVAALLGPNGAGKTTALLAMAGYVRADRGGVRWKGVSVAEQPHLAKTTMGLMIGEPAPYPYLTGRGYLRLYRELYRGITEDQVQQALEEVGMENHQHMKMKHYSTGMKQRIDLAAALLHRPGLLLLDEPFSGMDIEGRRKLADVLRRHISETGASIVISSHMVHDIEDIITHACIVHEGQWVETVSVADIQKSFASVEDYYLHCVARRREGAAS